ncbi:Uu.00g108510.m01.CDS01 [Anthostomella pinea]|uniref:Uu.00g108510.m01.CDS01 n=1 Tax=Anthostomella pinea TaxID=933095 RepID=A0AAI8VFK2_9PEZI|nr:Uu.00g108510.m01.CDS01 [Anthostomella pinea]
MSPSAFTAANQQIYLPADHVNIPTLDYHNICDPEKKVNMPYHHLKNQQHLEFQLYLVILENRGHTEQYWTFAIGGPAEAPNGPMAFPQLIDGRWQYADADLNALTIVVQCHIADLSDGASLGGLLHDMGRARLPEPQEDRHRHYSSRENVLGVLRLFDEGEGEKERDGLFDSVEETMEAAAHAARAHRTSLGQRVTAGLSGRWGVVRSMGARFAAGT